MILRFFDRMLRRRVYRLVAILDGGVSRSGSVSYAEARRGQCDLAENGFTVDIQRA